VTKFVVGQTRDSTQRRQLRSTMTPSSHWCVCLS